MGALCSRSLGINAESVLIDDLCMLAELSPFPRKRFDDIVGGVEGRGGGGGWSSILPVTLTLGRDVAAWRVQAEDPTVTPEADSRM